MPLRAVLLLLALLACGASLILWILNPRAPELLSDELAYAPDSPGEQILASADPEEASGSSLLPRVPVEGLGPRETLEAEQWDGVLLRVIEKASGLPIAGARVQVVEHREARRRARQEGRPDPRSPYEWLPRYGQTALCDESGELQLPRFQGRLLVSAAGPGLYGVLRLDAEVSEEQVIELLPDRQLAIQVIDQSGQPLAGVPVGLVCRQERRRQIIWSGRSDADGELLASHLQIYLPGWAMSSQLESEFLFPQRDRLAFPFSLENLPEDGLAMHMPPTGQVEVSLGYADGSDLLAPAKINLQVTGAVGGKRSTDLPPQNRLSVAKEIGPDKTIIPFIGLDLRLQADVRSGPHKFRKREFAGPRSGGELVRLRLEVDSRVAAIVGRAVDASGEPLQDTELELGFIWGEVVERRKTVRTDSNGLFEYAVTLGKRRPEGLFGELRRGQEESAFTARVELESFAGGRRLDLGDVPFLSAEVYARGRVFDDRERPVNSFRAWIEKFVPERRRGGQSQWVRDPEMSVVQGTEGRVQIRGRSRGEYRIRVAAPGHLNPEPLALAAGREFEVRLLRGARMAAEVLVDEWLPGNAIRILAQTDELPPIRQNHILRGRGERRSFAFPTLPAGLVNLSFFLRTENQELLRLPGLETQEGEEVEDDRLNSIDLRGRLNRIRVELRNATGQRPRRAGAKLLVHPVLPGGRISYYDLRPGEVDIASLQPSLDLTVLVPGFEMQRIRGAAGSMVIELVRSTAQRIQLVSDALPAIPPYSMDLELIHDPPLGLPNRITDAYTGKQTNLNRKNLGLQHKGRINKLGRLQLRNLSSGSYRLRLTLRKRGTRASARIDLPDRVRIARGIRPPLEIALPPELLQTAIAELR